MNEAARSPMTVDRSRRATLGLGASLLAARLAPVLGCDDGGEPDAPDGDGGAGGAPPEPIPWATGGTAGMMGSYPDPFDTELGASCTLLCTTSLGFCFLESPERSDISEGYPGLPTRLAFLVVDEACRPIANAAVHLWHVSNRGLYSGDLPTICTADDADATRHTFFRGVQSTNEAGRVDFDSCFPGWYAGRSVHLHMTVHIGDEEAVTPQIFFPQSLVDTLFTDHPDYAPAGLPDTSNEDDPLRQPGVEMSAMQMPDGSLLAWLMLVIRSKLDEPLCVIEP